jgi:hypothetical protein
MVGRGVVCPNNSNPHDSFLKTLAAAAAVVVVIVLVTILLPLPFDLRPDHKEQNDNRTQENKTSFPKPFDNKREKTVCCIGCLSGMANEHDGTRQREKKVHLKRGGKE